MDRELNSVDNLLERKDILIAEVMTSFRDLVSHATAPVDNSASTGQTAYSSMALEIMMSGIIKSTEDLLSLTRKLRELWIVGPLRAPGADDAGAERAMGDDAQRVLAMLNAARDRERARLVQRANAVAEGGFSYERSEAKNGGDSQTTPPPPPPPAAPGQTQAPFAQQQDQEPGGQPTAASGTGQHV